MGLLSVFGGLLGGLGRDRELRGQARAAKFSEQLVGEREIIQKRARFRAGAQERGTLVARAANKGLTGGGSAADILRQSVADEEFDLRSIERASELERGRFRAIRKGARGGRVLNVFSTALDILG